MKRNAISLVFSAASYCVMQLLSCGVLFAADTPANKTVRPPVHTVASGVYRQHVRQNYGAESGLPEGAVFAVAFDKKPIAATSNGIATFENGKWSIVHPTDAPVKALFAGNGNVLFVSNNQLLELSDSKKVTTLGAVPSDKSATQIAKVEKGTFVGTSDGVYAFDAGKLALVEPISKLLGKGTEIRQLASHGPILAVAAAGGLISYDANTKQATLITPETKTAGWLPVDARGVGFDREGNLWFASIQGVGHRHKGEWTLYTGYEGLPYNDFTGLSIGHHGDVWFGTKIGAIRFTGKEFEYRQGKRWLADDIVNSVVVAPSGDAWFATPVGVTCIESKPMTLREKADFFNSEIDKYHKRTEYGYVDGVTLDKPEDKSKVHQHDSDNDGLWTSMYGAAQCYEYASTKSAQSKKRANDAFRAVGFLSEVPQGGKQSPPYGFPARTILPTSGRNPNDHDNEEHDKKRKESDPQWKVIVPRWPVSADGKWYWKTDTSSDELDGHYFLYGLYYDLVAETEEEKKYARLVVDRVSTHLLEHGNALVDHDGKPTRWGRFGPDVLNTDVLTDCRGLNSIAYLSYLVVAEHVTGDPKYRERANELLYKYNYFTNVLNPKYQNGPGAGNQSDDEMAFMCYYHLFKYETDPKLRKQYMRSFARYFAQEESEACPLFSYIFATYYEPVRYHWKSVPESVVQDSLVTLQRFPLDRADWAYKNSHRLDIVPLPPHIVEREGRGGLRTGKVIPIDERFVNQWNNDPWDLDRGGSGTHLADGASYLLPYWMGVYHGFIKETAVSSK